MLMVLMMHGRCLGRGSRHVVPSADQIDRSITHNTLQVIIMCTGTGIGSDWEQYERSIRGVDAMMLRSMAKTWIAVLMALASVKAPQRTSYSPRGRLQIQRPGVSRRVVHHFGGYHSETRRTIDRSSEDLLEDAVFCAKPPVIAMSVSK